MDVAVSDVLAIRERLLDRRGMADGDAGSPGIRHKRPGDCRLDFDDDAAFCECLERPLGGV